MAAFTVTSSFAVREEIGMSDGVPRRWEGVLKSTAAACKAELKSSARTRRDEAEKARSEQWWELEESSR